MEALAVIHRQEAVEEALAEVAVLVRTVLVEEEGVYLEEAEEEARPSSQPSHRSYSHSCCFRRARPAVTPVNYPARPNVGNGEVVVGRKCAMNGAPIW
jgi:hypothetical protein